MVSRMLLIWLSLGCAGLFTAGCETDPAAPEPNTKQQLWNQVAVANCDDLIDAAGAIPKDCYDWGKYAWPGNEREDGYQAIQGWLHAATIDPALPATNQATIEIDYVALIEINRQSQRQRIVDVVGYDDNNPRPLTSYEGGLFPRWYHSNEFHPLSSSLISGGLLTIRPGISPDKICHWWMNSNGKYPRSPDCLYQLKCRIKISGPIAVQLAADLYKTVNSDWPDNKEAFHSPWYGDTGGQFKIICYPNY